MYIKHKKISDGSIVIINANISSCKEIFVNDKTLVIKMESEKDTINILLSSNEYAVKSQEKLFNTLGIKAPLSNILDLTNLDAPLVIEEVDGKEGV